VEAHRFRAVALCAATVAISVLAAQPGSAQEAPSPVPVENAPVVTAEGTPELVAAGAAAVPVHAPVAVRADFDAAVQSTGGRVLAYQTGPNRPMPLLRADGSWYSAPFDARIVAIPVSSAQDGVPAKLNARLLDNVSEGPEARCEGNADARTEDGTAQTAEVYGPVAAWNRMGQPAVLINTNFFDVRPQRNGLTWHDTGCTTPFGVYYDNQATIGAPPPAVPPTGAPPPGQSGNLVDILGTAAGEVDADRFYLGRKGLTNEISSPWGILSTFVISEGAARVGPAPTKFEMFVARAPEDNAVAEGWSAGVEDSRAPVVAFAGLDLLHPQGDAFIHDPEVRAARSAIGYSPELDRLVVVQAGSNEERGTGMTRVELQDLFRALGATLAMQLDSGGSSALVVNAAADIVWAGEGAGEGGAPPSACWGIPGAVCSPGIDQWGNGRKVPGWLALNLLPTGV
jgi:hypothetical protein